MIQGAITAIVTPFNADYTVDFDGLERVIHHQLNGNIDGIVVCGSTGEAITMTLEERCAVIERAVKIVNRRKPVIAGTSSSSTRETCDATKRAHDLGADGVLIAAPAYNRPQQEGLYQHFAAVAQAVPEYPVMLYNIPGRTAVNISTEVILRLVRDYPRSFLSYKDATNNLKQADELLTQCPDLLFLSGDDAATLPLGAMGAKGIVSVVGNLVPQAMHRLSAEILRGDFARAREQHRKVVPLIDACFVESNPAPVKLGCSLLGLCHERTRAPLAPCTDKTREIMKRALTEFGAL